MTKTSDITECLFKTIFELEFYILCLVEHNFLREEIRILRNIYLFVVAHSPPLTIKRVLLYSMHTSKLLK